MGGREFWPKPATFRRRLRSRGMIDDQKKSDEYRITAAACLEHAKLAANPSDSAFLLDLAFRWHMLAKGAVIDFSTVKNAADWPIVDSRKNRH
jgi:hypothetical protein